MMFLTIGLSMYYFIIMDKNRIRISREIYTEKNIDEWVECLICGYRAKRIGRHVNNLHDISTEDYKKNYGKFVTKIYLEKIIIFFFLRFFLGVP